MSQNGRQPEEAPAVPLAPLQPHFDLANRLMASYITALEYAAGADERAAEADDRATEMEERSKIEPVSGLYNRRLLEEEFARLHHPRGERSSDEADDQHVLAVVDIDNFSDVNTRLGHNGGDRKFREVGDAIKSSIRQRDIVARLGGGDEIGVLLPRVSLEQAIHIAEKIRMGVKERAGVTISLGVTGIRESEDLETTIGRADSALYTAKDRGRDQTVIIDPETFEKTSVVQPAEQSGAV